MIWAIIVLLVLAADQFTKYLVSIKIGYGELIEVIKNFFYLTYHHNQGAAWGILQNGRWVFVALTILMAAFMVVVLIKSKVTVLNIAVSFLLGGALGNLFDRIIRGGVTDFLDFYIGSYHFPTFNVADMSIVLGSFLLAIYMIFIYKEANKEKEGSDGFRK